MELNRKELKKISHDFNSISSRMMRVAFNEYNMVLKKFIDFIDKNEIIKNYINLGFDSDFDVEKEWNLVVHKDGYMFDFGPSTEQESYQIYMVLKYILDNIKAPHFSFQSIYGKKIFQDNVKEFNDRVVLVLIGNVEDYLTKVGIDMGLDENVVYNVNGGQVNVASGNATINATQNNGVSASELDNILKGITENLSKLEKENADEIADIVEMAREELAKSEPKVGRLRNCLTLIAPMFTIANGIPTLATNLQRLQEYISSYIH